MGRGKDGHVSLFVNQDCCATSVSPDSSERVLFVVVGHSLRLLLFCSKIGTDESEVAILSFFSSRRQRQDVSSQYFKVSRTPYILPSLSKRWAGRNAVQRRATGS